MCSDKQLEFEALAAVGEMLLFDCARGNPEEAARILRCARLFARSEDAAQRLSELCTEAGGDATWHESIVESLQDREDLQAAEAVMQRIREGRESATPIEDVMADLEADCAAKAQAESEPLQEPAFLEHLRAMRSRIDQVAEDVREIKHRVATLESGQGTITLALGHVQQSIAGQQVSFDRLTERVERVERRLEIA
jgi:predicted DNA-binding protein